MPDSRALKDKALKKPNFSTIVVAGSSSVAKKEEPKVTPAR